MSTTLTPYLSFGGNTREVFAFYEKALGAKIETMMSYDEMPASPAGADGCGDGPRPTGNSIMHACLALPGGAKLFAGDVRRPGTQRLPRAVAGRSGDDAPGTGVLGQDLRHAH